MATESSIYFKYANAQMAAEADYLNVSDFSNSDAIQAALIRGNNRSSKFTATQAQQFIDDGWTVVEHKSNTTTGFSGTLFRNKQTNELVLSFRSTEFADDATRDNQATNVLEIKDKGWAFGQIMDMEMWYASLKASGKIGSADTLAVTGYSLGGHLATAFNLLRQEEAAATGKPNPISATYTFNGAGVGDLLNGKSLRDVLTTFHEVRHLGAQAHFKTAEGKALYTQLKNTLSSHPDVLALGQAKQQVEQAIAAAKRRPPTDTALRVADYQLLVEALERARIVAAERNRVATLSNSGGAPLATDLQAVDAVGLDYQLGVLIASRSTQARPLLEGVQNTLRDERTYAPTPIPNFHDLFASNFPTAVANSQVHHGQAVGVIVEDQPLHRGLDAALAGAASIWNWNTKHRVSVAINSIAGCAYSTGATGQKHLQSGRGANA